MFYTTVVRKSAEFEGVADPNALEFDGGGSFEMLRAEDNFVGIANEWSIAMWLKPDTTNAGFMAISGAASNANLIDLSRLSGQLFQAILRDSSGIVFKLYRWTGSSLPTGDWSHVVVTWDGSSLLLYVDSVETAPDTTTVDDAGTMADTSDRDVSIASRTYGGSDFFDGRIHSTAIFDVALDQDSITEIFDGKGAFDLRGDSGDYDQSANLQHYWRHGFNASAIGEDLGNAAILIDVGAEAFNIDASDIVVDAPS